MADKLRQIQKFVEIVAGLVNKAYREELQAMNMPQAQGQGRRQDEPPVPVRVLRVVDMGSGRGYLTFAVHNYLSQTFQMQVK